MGGVDELEDLFPLSPFSPSLGGNNLWVTETFCPSLCLCCCVLCDAVRNAGFHSLCSICCTSLRTASPTVDTSLSPSAHALQDLNSLVHMVQAPVEVAFVHQGFDSCTHRESETLTCRVLLPLVPPMLLPGRREESLASQSADTQRILNESGTLNVSVHSCVHCVWNKGSVDKTGRGSVIESVIYWGSRNKIWILIEILIWI